MGGWGHLVDTVTQFPSINYIFIRNVNTKVCPSVLQTIFIPTGSNAIDQIVFFFLHIVQALLQAGSTQVALL